VVRGTPSQVDKPQWDLSSWLGLINTLKRKIPVLGEEGSWRTLCDYYKPFLFLEKASDGGAPSVYVCVNKDLNNATMIDQWVIPNEVQRSSKVISLTNDGLKTVQSSNAYSLSPAEILLFM
jgi:hypothetical protein